MPYALVPDGYSLKQVTKLQKKAVDDKRRHDNVVAFLSNDGTPALIGGGALLALTPFVIDALKESLESEGIVLTDQQKANVKTAFDIALISNPLTGPIALGKKLETLVKDLTK